MFRLLPEDIAEKFRADITEAVQDLVSLNRKDWDKDYVARPLDFISSKVRINTDCSFHYTFGISRESIEDNLDYLVEMLEKDKKILPNWDKKFYKDGLGDSWDKWTGIVTLESLITLDKAERLAR